LDGSHPQNHPWRWVWLVEVEKQSGVPGENDDFGQNDFSLAGDYEDPAEELTTANSNAED
jgi:hypothetical protein